jgi:hypothetical protein
VIVAQPDPSGLEVPHIFVLEDGRLELVLQHDDEDAIEGAVHPFDLRGRGEVIAPG